ncbi:MAG TPA: hypothetical protein VHE56_07825 [Mycobacteriales bacterium]|nr:hypothetical protein [Mycobacteriales bacterium]
MGVLIAFFVGWTIGAKSGPEGQREVVSAAREVLGSDELAALRAAVRKHTGFVFREMADWLERSPGSGDAVDEVIAKARMLLGVSGQRVG